MSLAENTHRARPAIGHEEAKPDVEELLDYLDTSTGSGDASHRVGQRLVIEPAADRRAAS